MALFDRINRQSSTTRVSFEEDIPVEEIDTSAELQEVNDAENDIASHNQVIEDTVEELDEVDSQIIQNEEVLESGEPISDEAIAASEECLKETLVLLYGRRQKNFNWSLEGNETPRERLMISNEGLKDVAKNVWEYLKGLFIKSVAFFKRLYVKITAYFDGTKKRAQALKKALEKSKWEAKNVSEEKWDKLKEDYPVILSRIMTGTAASNLSKTIDWCTALIKELEEMIAHPLDAAGKAITWAADKLQAFGSKFGKKKKEVEKLTNEEMKQILEAELEKLQQANLEADKIKQLPLNNDTIIKNINSDLDDADADKDLEKESFIKGAMFETHNQIIVVTTRGRVIKEDAELVENKFSIDKIEKKELLSIINVIINDNSTKISKFANDAIKTMDKAIKELDKRQKDEIKGAVDSAEKAILRRLYNLEYKMLNNIMFVGVTSQRALVNGYLTVISRLMSGSKVTEEKTK